jgi:hypothetical protein
MRNRDAVEGGDVLVAKWSIEVNDRFACLDGCCCWCWMDCEWLLLRGIKRNQKGTSAWRWGREKDVVQITKVP